MKPQLRQNSSRLQDASNSGAIGPVDPADNELQIGAVFTPQRWGEFAIERCDIFQKWLDGASVFDPTMGEGNLLEAFITYGLSKGYSIKDLPTHNLYGNELNTHYCSQALAKFREVYNVDITANVTNEDLFQLRSQRYDIIFGNPPWAHFVDLPPHYRDRIKGYFLEYGLVASGRNVLLGGSRVDIAALVIQIAIKEFLKPAGEAVFFVPLSLFLNDGAHQEFRKFVVDEVPYAVTTLFDFNDEEVFGGVATRYGLAHFVRDQQQRFPVTYFRHERRGWSEYRARPLFQVTDPLSVFAREDDGELSGLKPLVIRKESSPRQGINTGGANDLFFFDYLSSLDEDLVVVSNKSRGDVVLPRRFVFPLITAADFRSDSTSPSKWVLLPYRSDGKPLDWDEIRKVPTLQSYLEEQKARLQARKGVLLNAMISRGYWWGMLGVGAYSFFPFKVVWEAYGRATFVPKIFEGLWQANQSLQAFIPVRCLVEAERISEELSDKQVEKYLRSLGMEGTMNWAQPGKIKKLVMYKDASGVVTTGAG